MTVWMATGFGRGSVDSQMDMAVAAPSRAAAARAMGVSASWLAKYGSGFGDCPDAASDPGVLFVRRAGAFTSPWKRAR